MRGLFLSALFLAALCVLPGAGDLRAEDGEIFLRVRDWKTGEILAECPASVGGKLFFGWIHSLEHIPWNEYYHIDENLGIVLDSITFPAFGAGIPENKGKVCYVKDGLIHMEEIGQKFGYLDWLNSATATGDIMLDGVLVTRGEMLPHHARVCLTIERGEKNERR